MRMPRSVVLSLLALSPLVVPSFAVSAQSLHDGRAVSSAVAERPVLAAPGDYSLNAAQRARRVARLAEEASLAATPAHMPAAPADMADGFESSGFAQFMSSKAGRILRVVAGAGMIAGGIAADSDLGTGIAIAGAVPLLAGTFDFCVLSPLFGGPLSGKAIRAAGQ